MERPVVHIVGAGLAGLAAAVRLSKSPCAVIVHEASPAAGGRCRSFFDPSVNATIDNGNHLLLSGNRAALAYLDAIGARGELTGPGRCEIAFADMASGERWTIRVNEGRLPWWLLMKDRRPPGARIGDAFGVLGLFWASPSAKISEAMTCSGPFYERLWRPFLLAALNAEPRDASASLAAATIRETLARGGRACHPLIAANGLSRAFVDPAVKLLLKRGARIRYERRLRSIAFADDRVASLEFENDSQTIGDTDFVILATPAHVASTLVPELVTPQQTKSILNGHFGVTPPSSTPQIMGVVNGMAQWVFAFADRLSVTISDAERFMEAPRERLAADLWREVAALTGLGDSIPSWRIIKERRATFAALPEEAARRPPTATAWRNLLLAGDYVRTGLPATIESAVRSADAAAEVVLAELEGR